MFFNIPDVCRSRFQVLLVLVVVPATYRCRAVKSGKWNDRACVVKSRENARRPFRYFVQKQNRANANFERYVCSICGSEIQTRFPDRWNIFEPFKVYLEECIHLIFKFEGFHESTIGMYVPPMFWRWRGVNYSTGNSWLCRRRSVDQSFSAGTAGSIVYFQKEKKCDFYFNFL